MARGDFPHRRCKVIFRFRDRYAGHDGRMNLFQQRELNAVRRWRGLCEERCAGSMSVDWSRRNYRRGKWKLPGRRSASASVRLQFSRRSRLGKVRVSVRSSDLSERAAGSLKSSSRSASEPRCGCCCLYRDRPRVIVRPIQFNCNILGSWRDGREYD